MGLFFYPKKGSIRSIGDLPTTNIIEPIKRVYREEHGLRLVSINPKYQDIFLSYDEDPRIVGIVVGNFRPTVD